MFVSTLGAIPVSSADALAEAQAIFIGVFGQNADLDEAGTNGQFIQEMANLIIDNDSALALLYGQMYNGNYAQGVFLDAIAAFSQISRQEATYSVVTCRCVGLSGVVIPAGSQAISTNNDIFASDSDATIGGSGYVDIEFTAINSGVIPVTINTVNRIVNQISGWDTVNNEAAGVAGTTQETDYSFRIRRRQTLAINSTGTYDALIAALNNDTAVEGFWILINRTSVPIVTNTGIAPYSENVTVSPHAIYLSVFGDTDQNIAAIIYRTLSGGCDTSTGNTTVVYTNPLYNWVQETYKLERPVDTRLEVDIDLPGSSSDYPADITTQIQDAIYNNYYGLDGTEAVTMTSATFVSRFYAPLASIGITNVTSLTIGVYGAASYTEFQLPITKFGTLAKADIIVTI